MHYKLKPIQGFSGYFIRSNGDVISLKGKSARVLKAGRASNGRLTVSLRKDGKSITKLVYRLLAEAFIPNPMGLETVDHIRGIDGELELDLGNMRWMSNSDNCKAAWENGLTKNTIRAQKRDRKLKMVQARVIRRLYNRGISQSELGSLFGVASATIKSLIDGKTYKES